MHDKTEHVYGKVRYQRYILQCPNKGFAPKIPHTNLSIMENFISIQCYLMDTQKDLASLPKP